MSMPSSSSSQESTQDEKEDTEEVRVFKPSAIILDFHGTISPVNFEEQVIEPYIRDNLKAYLENNWDNKEVIQIVAHLKQRSHDEHFKYDNESAPLIDDQFYERKGNNLMQKNRSVIDESKQFLKKENENSDDDMKSKVCAFVLWQMESLRDSDGTFKLKKMIFMDGFKKGVLKIPIFTDVPIALKQFRKDGIKLYVFSSLNESTTRTYLTNTDEGDIASLLDGIFDHQTGFKADTSTYKSIAKKLNIVEKKILLITDYGQEAKCAGQAGWQCLLMVRPGNRKIRDHYIIKSNTIHSLQQLKFVANNIN